ncbi:hypothetical protein [Enterovibrio norvegicus]|uniref:hypothetical protein n=1 Tax=Enterovibrio norvegicus TaxID=188144 RepID=UPI00352E7B2A
MADKSDYLALFHYLKLLDQKVTSEYEACQRQPNELIPRPDGPFNTLQDSLFKAPWSKSPYSLHECCTGIEDMNDPSDFFLLIVLMRQTYVALGEQLDIDPDFSI